MKLCKFTLALVLVAAAGLPAVAQSQMSLNIPFEFTVNGKTLPAGHYSVWATFRNNNGAWTINGDKGVASVITHSVQSPFKPHNHSLVFVRAGDHYFLAQIWNDAYWGGELKLPDMKPLIVAEKDHEYVEIAAK